MRKYIYWLLPVTWMGVIFYASSQPYEKQDVKPFLTNMIDLSFLEPFLGWLTFTYNHAEVSVNALGITGFIEFFLRKGVHFIVFFILMYLFYLAFIKTTSLSWHRILLVSFVLALAYAGLDEFHQGFTINRTPYIGDVLLDGCGAFIAGMILCLKRKKQSIK